ncbi:MAG: oligosaccharide repeat unit polymerase [Candidatus Delongbacteria bacterium]|nr:oligosaccharide repeat unit polymerase [Candidatus Delongbacteria bacterium]
MLGNIDPGAFRGMVYSSEGTLGKYMMPFAYFVKPSLYASAFISIAGTLLGKLPKKIFFISFINLLLYSISTLGRFPIFLVVIVTFLGFYLLIGQKKIQLKYIFGIFLMILFLVSVSAFRKSDQPINLFAIIKNYSVWYFTGPFTAFDYFLDNYKVGVDYDYSYFRGFIAGFDWIFTPFIRKLSTTYENINNSYHEITASFRSLGGEAWYHNSHYTMLYTFYRDAGEFGVLIYSFILGMINSVLYNKFRRNYSIVSFSMILIVLYVSLMGVLKWEFRYLWSIGSVLIIIFIAQKFVIRKKKLKYEV